MKNATAPLINALNENTRLVCADLYTITLLGGTAIRYTSADVPITFGSTTWARGPIIGRNRLSWKMGITVDSLEMTISDKDGVTINGKPIMAFIAAGGLDGARVLLQRSYSTSWAAGPAGVLHKFSGRVNDVDMSRHEARITVASDVELLNTKVPRNLYQGPCANTVYDAACGQSRAAKTVSGAVTSVVSKLQFGSGLAQANGYFDLGVVTFTSGANAGITRTIRSFSAGGFVLLSGLPFPPAMFDTFNVYPGCDKTVNTCVSKFNNKARYRGMPFIPVPETVT